VIAVEATELIAEGAAKVIAEGAVELIAPIGRTLCSGDAQLGARAR
jgi:hypothetical protein